MSKQHDIFGIHPVRLLLELHPTFITHILVQQSRSDQRLQELINTAEAYGITVESWTRTALDKRAATLQHPGQHQGVIAQCKRLPQYDENDIASIISKSQNAGFLLVLDGVQDPHNLGACLRVANAMGVDAVIAPKDRAVGLTPIVAKVSCGASLLTPFIRVTNLSRTLKNLQQQGMWVVGADARAEQSIGDIDATVPLVVLMGAEGAGLRTLSKKHCDYLVKIPMNGAVESLNVAVATGICLYEVVSQRRKKGD